MFGWLLFRQSLVKHAFCKRMFPEASLESAMCTGGEENCCHLFFECPFARAIWAKQKISWVDITHISRGLLGMDHGRCIQKTVEEGGFYTVLRALWLHRNNAIFYERMVLVDSVAQDMEGFVSVDYKGVRGERVSIWSSLYFGGLLISGDFLLQFTKKNSGYFSL